MNERITEIIKNYYNIVNKARQERDSALESILISECRFEAVNERKKCLFASLNKVETLRKYEDQVKRGECYQRDAVCDVRLTIEDWELYEWFTNTLLNNRDWMKGKGGTNTDDPRAAGYEYAWQIPEGLARSVKWYSVGCILVNDGQHDVFIIDPQGYDYARYVGLCVDELQRRKKEAEDEAEAYYRTYAD